MSGTEKIQRHFNSMAHRYDVRYDGDRGRRYYDHLSELVFHRISGGGKLLDLGCGTGLFVERYLMRGENAMGLDISRGMIERAIQRCPGTSFTVASADQIPFREGTFEVLVSLLVFSYVSDPERMLREVRGVLKPGGKVLLVEPRLHVTRDMFDRMLAAAAAAGFRVLGTPKVSLSRAAVLGQGRQLGRDPGTASI